MTENRSRLQRRPCTAAEEKRDAPKRRSDPASALLRQNEELREEARQKHGREITPGWLGSPVMPNPIVPTFTNGIGTLPHVQCRPSQGFALSDLRGDPDTTSGPCMPEY